MSASMEILEANTSANRSILPETTSFTTSFTSDAVPPQVSTSVTTLTTSTTTATSTSLLSSTFLHSPSTTISSSISSATRRISTFLPTGTDKKSPPGITINYIPGSNPEEDFEGVLIVNKESQGTKETPTREKTKNEEDRGSKSSLSDSHFESPRRKEKEKEREKEEKEKQKLSLKDSKKKKKKRKLERSSRIENSVEENTSEAPIGVVSDKRSPKDMTDNEEEDQKELLGTADESNSLTISPMPSAVSAPARYLNIL